MDLYEHQAQALFEEHGIPVPRAEVTDSPREARAIARRLGGSVVVKEQVKTGGRGKAGGVRLGADPAGAERAARRILGMDIKGHTVGKVMLAQPVDIESEFYIAYVLDRAAGRFLAIASAQGGMDIEEVAALRPEAVARIHVDPAEGVTSAKAGEIAEAAGLPPGTVDVLVRLWEVLVHKDAVLVEVNPLVRTRQGHILALDGKVTLDDNARFRQSRRGTESIAYDDPPEAAAAAKGLNYVKLDGEVGVIGNGAGLVMSTLDVVAGCGARPANFLDIGGDAEERAAAYIREHVTKPVVGYIAGFTAPEGRTMGHAGAIVSGSAGTAQAKKAALEAVGVKVGNTPTETARLVLALLDTLREAPQA